MNNDNLKREIELYGNKNLSSYYGDNLDSYNKIDTNNFNVDEIVNMPNLYLHAYGRNVYIADSNYVKPPRKLLSSLNIVLGFFVSLILMGIPPFAFLFPLNFALGVLTVSFFNVYNFEKKTIGKTFVNNLSVKEIKQIVANYNFATYGNNIDRKMVELNKIKANSNGFHAPESFSDFVTEMLNNGNSVNHNKNGVPMNNINNPMLTSNEHSNQLKFGVENNSVPQKIVVEQSFNDRMVEINPDLKKLALIYELEETANKKGEYLLNGVQMNDFTNAYTAMQEVITEEDKAKFEQEKLGVEPNKDNKETTDNIIKTVIKISDNILESIQHERNESLSKTNNFLNGKYNNYLENNHTNVTESDVLKTDNATVISLEKY